MRHKSKLRCVGKAVLHRPVQACKGFGVHTRGGYRVSPPNLSDWHLDPQFFLCVEFLNVFLSSSKCGLMI